MSRTALKSMIVAIPLLACGLYGTHFLLGRPDRILEAKRRDRMSQVERELLRFEYEQGDAAKTLNDLVPAYLRPDEIENEHGPLYVYDAERRTLAESRGAVIHGLFPHNMPPATIKLPETIHKTRLVTLPPSSDPLLEEPRTEPETAAKPSVPVVKTEDVAISTPKPQTTQTAVAPSEPTTQIRNPQSAIRNAFLKLPPGPELADPPAGAYVFEAELFTDTNYAWEAHPDESSACGAYALCKEGIANNSAQTHFMVGNFYDVHAKTDLTYLKYHFNLPVGGMYYCYGRMWTTDTHCSNNLSVDFDQGGPGIGSMDNRTPFRWVWTEILTTEAAKSTGGNPRRLEKGDHFLHLFPWEDGIMVDQYILSPTPIAGAQHYKPNLVPGRGTAWEKNGGPPVHVSFDVGNAVISPSLPPDIRLFVRKLRSSSGTASVKVRLKNAGKDGGEFVALDSDLDLNTLPESGFLPLNFKALDLEKLPRREYELEATLTKDDKTIASASVVLMKPWVWEVFGPGKYMDNSASGPLDGEKTPPAGDKRAWTPFKDKCYDWFGVLDFGLQTSGNSKHAPADCTIYARTRVNVPRDANYRIKVMADDQMVLWMDGEEIFRIDDRLPVTRSARSFVYKITAGEHHFRMRINQTDGPWQAFMRIRTEDDDTTDVLGLDAEEKK